MELYDRITTLLGDAVADIFQKIGEEYNVQYGDCPPDVEYDIDNATEELADQIISAVRLQMKGEEE